MRNELALQGVIRLEREDAEQIRALMRRMRIEQECGEENMSFVKFACLQMILVTLGRAQAKKGRAAGQYSDRRQQMVQSAVHYIEEHLTEKISFSELAARSYVSIGYFRSAFKDVTGVSPVDYLNRLRIIRSLPHLRDGRCSVTEAAQRVGIDDPNYFARLFKRVMGYTPRYYRNNVGREDMRVPAPI